MTTRAVHPEVIEEMSASIFINALRRFVAVRGPVRSLHSDFGTNFVSARNKFQDAIKEMDKEAVVAYLKQHHCEWKFNPPHASHMGGAWERLIGVCRRILEGILVTQRPTRLTHELLTTFMAEVMAIANARPLVPVSNDPEVPDVLSPAAILTGKSSPVSAPPGDFSTCGLHAQQWRRTQHLAEMFWIKEYLLLLQPRPKWINPQTDLKTGDVVLVKDEHSPRNDWPTGRISETFAGRDGRVRKVSVRIPRSNTMLTRPMGQLVRLLVADA